jgi:tRNA pseudouridine55 synthase
MAPAQPQFRAQRRDVNGWLIVDKPLGMTSTMAVARAKRLFNAKKAGHAGTLDPLATGLLPIAFGEATKTVPFVQDGAKAYRFTVRWGCQTTTDDGEGEVMRSSEARPQASEIAALLPHFTGTILQRPPQFSAIKVGGERAYDIARDGENVILPERAITIHALRMIACHSDEAVFEAECGKGTYVRAVARDMGERLRCFGYVTALRRTRVGPFGEDDGVDIEACEAAPEQAASFLRPVEAGLTDVPCVVIDQNGAARLRRGQSLILRGREAPVEGSVYAVCAGTPIAFGRVEQGQLVPQRVFNLPF